jgi:hypothetical protein
MKKLIEIYIKMEDNVLKMIGDDEIIIKTSVIDYLEPINGGVPIMISITIYEFTFQSIYWIHPENHYFLECEDNFLRLWGVNNSLNLPFYIDLCKDIESILPEKKMIFKEILGI